MNEVTAIGKPAWCGGRAEKGSILQYLLTGSASTGWKVRRLSEPCWVEAVYGTVNDTLKCEII